MIITVNHHRQIGFLNAAGTAVESEPKISICLKIATVKLGNMVRFRALLCFWGYLASVNVCLFNRGPTGVSDSEISCWKQVEQLEYSGQLSMNETWGIWFYRRPTNPPNLKKALREWLGVSYSIENDAHKQPQWRQFYIYRDWQFENTLASLIL